MGFRIIFSSPWANSGSHTPFSCPAQQFFEAFSWEVILFYFHTCAGHRSGRVSKFLQVLLGGLVRKQKDKACASAHKQDALS